jgi:peptide deformylase
MAIRPIITEQLNDPRTNPILRGKAKRVGRIDDSIRRLIDDMIETMRDAPGVGLAAPQIGVPLRVIVIEHEDQLYTVVNPEIVKNTGEITDEEGCLSAPHWQGPVSRASSLVVKGRDRNGKEVRIKAEGWLARIFQHEVDHLDGTLFLDRVHDRSKIHWVDPAKEDSVTGKVPEEAEL